MNNLQWRPPPDDSALPGWLMILLSVLVIVGFIGAAFVK